MTRRLATRASRRSVLGGLLVGLTATGCELDPTPDDDDGSASGADPSAEPDDDPDAQLVSRVVDDLTGALALVTGVAHARRPLASEVAPWREQHVAHLEALEASGHARPERLRGSATELLTRVRRQEATLQRQLAEAAVSARSGALASLLASMSAAVAQQLAADAEPGR